MQCRLKLMGYLFILLGALSFLSGCGESKKTKELNQYFEEVKARPAPSVADIPKFPVPASAVYSAGKLRSPFQPNVTKLPDEKRHKDPLEAFPLDSLKLVGTLSEKKELWALILAPSGMVYKVSVGMHLGQNYGRITSISKNSVKIVETVPEGSGWRQHPTSLSMTAGVIK